MKLNTYRGGRNSLSLPWLNTIKTDKNTQQSNPGLSRPRNTTRKQSSKTDEPSSDEISVAKSIDEIFLDVGKLNLSYYDEIDMIRERLLQLETITFHGVLDIPYILSPSSDYEDKTTLIGGGGSTSKSVKKNLPDAKAIEPENELKKLLATIKGKISARKDLLKQITPNNIETIDALNTEFVKVSKEILTLTKEYNALIDGNEDIDNNEKLEEDKIIAKLDLEDRCEHHIDSVIERIKKLRDDYTKERNSILLEHENSENMKIHDTKVHKLIFEYDKLRETVNKPPDNLPADIIYTALITHGINVETTINDAIRRLDVEAIQYPNRKFERNINWYINLQPLDPFTITYVDCDKIITAAINSELNLNVYRELALMRRDTPEQQAERIENSAMAQKAAGARILNVWKKNFKEIIELQKIMYYKGYSTNPVAVTNLREYNEGMSDIDHRVLLIKLKNAFREKQGPYYIKVRYKEGQNMDTDPCHMFFFYSLRVITPIFPREMPGDFHLTIHLGGELAPVAPVAPIAPVAPVAPVAPIAPVAPQNINQYTFSEGKIHLRKSSKENTNKANLRPYIFTKRGPNFIGKQECMQLLPLYQPNANPTETVIYTGRIITKVLNDYLQTLHIHSKDLLEGEYQRLIYELSLVLSSKQNSYTNRKLIKAIEKLEDDIKKQFIEQTRYLTEQYCLSHNIATDNSIKDLYIKMINFIDYEKARNRKDERRIILTTNNDELRNMENDISRRLEENEAERLAQRVIRREVARAEAIAGGGKKKQNIQYTKKRYNKVSRKRYNKVSRKRYNKVSRKRKLLKYL